MASNRPCEHTSGVQPDMAGNVCGGSEKQIMRN
jgi:hypothetical protein